LSEVPAAVRQIINTVTAYQRTQVVFLVESSKGREVGILD